MTLPFSDPLFSQVARRELQLAAADPKIGTSLDEMMRDHGVPGWQSDVVTDRPDADSSPPRAGRSLRAAAVDVAGTARSATEGSPAAPPEQPGRRSLTPEQHVESRRIQWMIANFRHRAAERERLEDLAHTQEWMR